MPELPEVETIKLSLEKKIIGLSIKNIQILNSKSFLGDVNQVENSKVIKVWRRAKVLGIDLSRGPASSVSRRMSSLDPAVMRQDLSSLSPRLTLLFHLKMSGQVIYIGEKRFVGGHPTKDMLGEMPNKHSRVIFEFSNGAKLFFNDQRKFGWIKLVQTSELENINHGYSNKLGPEPLDENFTGKILQENLLKHQKTPVKVAILDSSVVAGVGNIYACEGCFVAGIDPRTKVKDLTDDQFKSLHRAVQKVLRDGIKYGGSTKTHFVDSDGKKGYFLDYAFVYNRVGKPCKVCGTTIKKIKLGGRGTFYCPECQK
jgi:formamidopyrimidine-DNA glycosylase